MPNSRSVAITSPPGLPAPGLGARALRALPIAPLVPVLIALAAGIVIDRVADPLETGRWITLAARLDHRGLPEPARRARLQPRRARGVLALGGGWHHFRWNDRVRDDLSESVTERSRPVWVRGVVTEQMGLRTSENYGPGDPDRVVTRMVLALTEISDGTRWRTASGRASLIVAGDRTDVHAGEPVEAAGQLERIAGPLNPGEFDHRAVSSSPGNPPAARRGQSRGPVSRPAGNPLAMDPMAGRPPRLQSRTAGGPARSAHRAAGRGLDPRSARGHRSRRSTTPSRGPARLTCWPSRVCSFRCWPVLESALPLRGRVPRAWPTLGVALVTLGYSVLVGLRRRRWSVPPS